MFTAKIHLNEQLVSCLYIRRMLSTDNAENLYPYHWEYCKLVTVLDNKVTMGQVVHKTRDGFERLMLLVLQSMGNNSYLFMQQNFSINVLLDKIVVEFAVNGSLIGYTSIHYSPRNEARAAAFDKDNRNNAQQNYLYTWNHYVPERGLVSSKEDLKHNKITESIETLIVQALSAMFVCRS